jgi:hypothetical protein
MKATQDQYILEYQQTGCAENLIEQYDNFLNKYYALLHHNTIDFSNYDIRCFLACYISEEDVSKDLRRGRYPSQETIKVAYKILQHLRHKLRNHTWREVKNELLIPFLFCARIYKSKGIGFDKYLYKAYKYNLKRHLDINLKWDALDKHTVYRDFAIEEDSLPDEFKVEEFEFYLDEAFELTDPRWIHGSKSTGPFKDLKPHERYILVKYYYEDKTDKEIARMLPYNPKSIHRIRMRIKKKLIDSYSKGELKCLRLEKR